MVTKITAPVPYPRNVLSRRFLRALGRLLLPLLARPQITGLENLPAHGPLILAGNHVSFFEVVLMVVYPPYLVELIGTGDIPIDPTFAPLANFYGFIPINRGNLDRTGLAGGLSVLEQGGILGIFPEGGIWQPDGMKAHTGIAWLSSQAQAPVVPIGFGGMRGAIARILHLKRPRLVMNIGPAIPPIQVDQAGMSRKEALVEGANRILAHIHALVPPDEVRRRAVRRDERYDLILGICTPDRKPAPGPVFLQNANALALFLMQPVLMDVFVRNLRMSQVIPLQDLSQPHPAIQIHAAVLSILEYLETNRGFLTYRFGMDVGLKMQDGLHELLQFAHSAAQSGYWMEITPTCTYIDENGRSVTEQGNRSLQPR